MNKQTKDWESKTDFDTTGIEKTSVLIATKIDEEILGGEHQYDRSLIAKMIYEGLYNFTAKTIKDRYRQGFADGSDLTGRIGEEAYQDRLNEARQAERQRLIEEVRELVDGMRKNTTLSHSCLQSWGGCDCNDNKNYNQALDDLLQELNKLKGINE